MGQHRRVSATVTSFPSAARLAASSELIATLPEEVAPASPAPLSVHPPLFAVPELPMLCLWHPSRSADPRHLCLRERVIRAVRACATQWRRGDVQPPLTQQAAAE